VTIGSVEGNGAVFLGGNNLTVGSNDLSTTFSGVIQDGGIGDGAGAGGSLTKIGKGKLILSGANTYTGGATVRKGTLLVTNRTGSATGTGTVKVKAGTLGGTGRVSGAVAVASGTTSAILAPGNGTKPGGLTTLSALTFGAHATYKIDLDSTIGSAARVTANGVTITTGAMVSINDQGSGTLGAGQVFPVIHSTGASPITGTFSNLPDGSTITVGNNTYKVSYGFVGRNDLVLIVQ
jgi:autotransporter-associated beta strand protein